jgi:glycosyltransferase involved in cell wall biosynthesis
MTQTPDFRLGIVCSVPAVRDAAGNLTCNHAIGRLLDQLRKSIPGAELAIPVLSVGHKSMKHKLEFKPEEITELPPLKTVMGSQRHFFATRRILRDFASRFDVLFVRVPFQVPLALRHLGKPKLLHVISNPYQVITASSDYRGLMRALAVRFAAHSNATMRRLAAEPDTRVATNGAEMWELLRCREGRVVVSSCLYEREMQPREDLSLGQPPRILFVGYLRPEKGIRYLLEAFESLRKRRPVKLTLVGGTDRATGSEAETHEQIRKSPYRDDISIVGMVDFGQPLFDLYRNHDVMVVPSLSEGTPRTIVEARSFGCPVVASNVGGIPSSVQDGRNGLLVPPRDAPALDAAIERILSDDALRRRLIATGLEDSKQQSLEYFTGQLVEELRILARQAGDRRAAAHD